jgi:N-acetylglucosamine transport system substrate-binding protein
MRWSILALSLLTVGLIGCGSSTSEPSTASDSPEKEAPAAPMLKVEAPKPNGSIEVQTFKGGYDVDFFQKCAASYEKAHAGTKVQVDGNPRVWEQLQPRMVSGSPPDLMFPGWGMDHWALAEEGQVFDLTDALKSPGADGKPWGDSFESSLLKLGQLDGQQVTLPYYLMMYGWWYDPDVFAKNGWTVPKTFTELLVLAPKIKEKGIAPITFQGQYPYYLTYGMLMPWILSHGGEGALKACQNMEAGAWKSESVLAAAKMMEELRDKGFFQDGCISMSHTEAQQQFLNGKAAMVPCGTWLKAEMSKMMKPGTKLAFMRPPVIEGGKGDPSAIQVDIEPWMVPTKAKDPNTAIDFFKHMTSLENAKAFVKEKGTLMAIKGSNEGEMPEELKIPAQMFKESNQVWAIQFRHWYKTFFKEMEDSITALVTKKLDAQGFCERLEKAAAAVRDDETIKKRKV